MADEIRIPVSADTSRMEADISNAARRAQVTIAPTINSRGLDSISRPLGKITGQADEFTKSMEAANARVLAFGASVGVLNAVAKAFSTIVSSSIEVERTLSEIAVASGEAGKNLDSLGKGIFNIAKLTGTSFKDAANAALEFSRQGAGVEESLKRAQAALVLTRTTGLDAAESVKGLTAAVSSFNDVGLDYERVVNKLAAVDTKFAVSSRDLIEGITRSASVAQEAGVSFDELTALITTLQEKTARGGAVIGNALKTIFTRVQSTENLDLLRSLGIAVNDVEGNILPATTIIKKLAAEIQNLDDATRKSVLIKIGGGFQIDKLSAVLKDVADANGVFARSLGESQNAANQAFSKVEQLGRTTGAAFDKLVLSSNELASNIGKIGVSGNLKNILGNLDSAVQSINKAITGGDEGETIGNKLAQGIIAGIGNVLSGPGLLLAVGVGLKLLTNFGKFLSESIQTQLGVNTAKKEQASLEKDIFVALTKNQDVQSVILSLEGNKAKQAEYILGIYKQQAAFLEKMSSISKTIAPVLYEGGIRSSMEGVKDVKKAAGGYMPIGSAIADERKNSPAGSRIIVDNNFPMGGGKRGTMVYNSNEKRIPNFAGTGGDAIIPNYRPRSAARGYIPNFANNNPAVNTTGLPELALDASEYGIAGLTIGGKEDVIRARFKRENLLKPVEGDPILTKIFSKYGAFGIENVPVGNVYRRENENLSSIQAKESDIKKLFRDRANATLSPKIGEFIQQELAYLQIKPTAAMDYALRKGEKLDFINDQTAGKFFEIMLNAANMDFLDDNWGQFTSDSGADERSSFDIYNLKPELAKQYGLKEKDYSYVEVKASKSDLAKDLTRKTTNELLKNGTLRQKFLSKYGKGISAANGYIPNFNKKLSPIIFELGNNFEKLFLKNAILPTPSAGATLDVESFDQEKTNKDALGINPLSKRGDVKLRLNRNNSISLFSKYLRTIGDKITLGTKENFNGAAEGFAMFYDGRVENAKADDPSYEVKDVSLGSLLNQNVSLKNMLSGNLQEIIKDFKFSTGSQNFNQIPELRKKKFNFKFIADRVLDSGKYGATYNIKDYINKKNAYSGYIPNFADGPLMDAIQREKLESGLPLSAISVVKDGKLKNSQNPNGLAVINKRDEPNGKIPNFAAGDEKFEIIFQRLEKLFNESGDGFAKAVENAAKRLDTSVESISDTLLKRLEGKDGAGTSNTDTQKENTTATKENTKEKEKEKKTVQDSLYNLLKWQTVLSFTSGVLSKFGDDAGKVGDALSGFGTALLSANEGVNAIKGVLKFKEGDTVKGLFSSGVESAKKAAKEAGSGKFAQAKAGAGAFLTGGGGQALAGAALTGGIYALAAYEGLKGLDSVIQILARTSEKSKNAINVLSQAQEKYSVSLDATGKKIQEQVSERFKVSGAGLSGFVNEIGLTGLFRGGTTKQILKTAGATNLDEGANAAIAGDIASLITPSIQAQAKEGTGIFELEKKVAEETVRILKEVEDMSRERIGFTAPSGPGGRGFTRKLKNGETLAPGEIELKGAVNQEKFEKNLLKIRDQQVKKADDATYKLKLQQEILTANATALRKNLDITQELAKAYASIPSSLENSLSLLRDSVFTSESEKDSLSFKIKILEEERKLRADINDIALSTAKEEISKKISEGKALTPQVKATIETGFTAVNEAVTAEEKRAKIKELVNKLTGDENDLNKGLKQIVEEKLSLLDTEIQKAQTLSDIRKQQIAQENFNNSIIKQQNFYFQAQKDVFSGYLALKEQALQKEKERLGYVRQIQDAEKELSRIGKDTPRDRFQQTLEDINTERNRKIQDAQIAARESFLANQRNVVQKLAEKPETQDLAAKALGAKSRQELINIGKEGFKLEESSFESSVINSAKEFYDIIIKTAVDYVGKSQPAGTSSPISSAANAAERAAQSGVMPQTLKAQKELIPKVSQEISDLKESLRTLQYEYGDQPNDEVKNLEERIRKLQEFNNKLEEQINLTEKSKKKFNELNEKNPGFIEGRFGIGAEPDTGKRIEEAGATAKTKTAQAQYAELQRTDFRQGMRDSLKSIDTDLQQFGNTLGKQIPLDFRNGLVDAMKALSDPNATTSLKERLMGVASAFLNKINDTLMTNAANKITSGLFGNGQGKSGLFGSAFGMSTGGEISRGSGYKDDVPAMLMKGEYVIKKSAVSKYGKDFFDKLNRGKVQGFADGGIVGFQEADRKDLAINPNNYTPYGQVTSGNLIFDQTGKVSGISNYTGREENREDAIKRAQSDFYARGAQTGMGGFFTPGTYGQGAIMGQRNLLSFATQGTTGTQFDVMRGGGGAASVDIAGGSANLSLFALRNQDNLRNVEYSSAQQKALDLYLGQIGAEKEKFQKEEQARKEIEEFKKRIAEEAKAQRRALIGQVISTVAMAAISAGVSSFSKGVGSARQAAELKGEKLSTLGALKGGFTGGTFNGETRGGLFNILGSSGFKDFSVVGANVAGLQGNGLAKFDSASGKYIKMDPYEFGARYGSLNYAGKLGYDQLGSPVRNDFSSGGMGSKFNFSKLNPMNWFGSSGSKSNFSDLGFGNQTAMRNTNLANDIDETPFEYTYKGKRGQAAWQGGKLYFAAGGTSFPQWEEIDRKAAGGYVAGNGMGDNVPAMLNGGEFVISKQAAQNIGYNNLQAMNAGAGGAGSNEIATRIEIKLQELVEKVAGVGTINITVESGKGGGENQGGSNENASNQESQNRDLARKIKDVVINVIREEKRLGGMLR